MESAPQQNAVVYILQLTPDKLQKEQQEIFKKQVLNLFQKESYSKPKKLVIVEAYVFENLDDTDTNTQSDKLKEDLAMLQKIFINGYNILEPEHSKKYPLQEIDILAPQIFGSESALFDQNLKIAQVYYGEDTNLIKGLKEKKADLKFAQIDTLNSPSVVNLDFTFAKDASWFADNTESSMNNQNFKQYEHVCIGGTFDHLHSGHKILLTQASLLTKQRMLLGITSTTLLQKKQFASFLESYEKRYETVRGFLRRLNGDKFEVDVFELQDPAGRAGTDEQITACVLTPEVMAGGDIINAKRKENGLPELALVVVDLVNISDSDDGKFANKMSSTLIRKHMFNAKQQHAFVMKNMLS